VTQKLLWRGVLGVALCVALAIPAQAQQNSLNNIGRNIVIGIVAVAAALVVITVVVVHESRKKRTVTGCVTSGENGISVTDEKDKRIYALSGSMAAIKPGDRVTLQGKTVKPKGASAPLAWEVSQETKDFGACQP
jgi:F420-0:gamma-glutamyl ligase